MKRSIVLIALLLCGLWTASAWPAAAADQAVTVKASVKTWRMTTRSAEMPFPRSWRSQAVWDGGPRWTACGSYCAWGQTQCLERDSQGLCLKLTDKCDRLCQRESRTAGGPLLPLEMPWD